MGEKEIQGRKFSNEVVVRKPRLEVTAQFNGQQVKSAFSNDPRIQVRRMQVFKWMMDGYILDSTRMNISALSMYLGETKATIENDVWMIKKKLGFMFKTDERIKDEVSAVAGLLRQINMDDRGRALEEIAKIDKDLEAIRNDKKVPPPMLLQVKAQYLKIANDCGRGLDKFLDVLTRAANNIHVHTQNAQIGSNNTVTTQNNFSPLDAVKMLEERGYGAQIGTKKIDAEDAELSDG